MDRRLREHFDWPIVWTTLALFAFGLINLYSATIDPTHDVGASRLFVQQCVFGVVGVTVMFAVTVIDYRVLERLAYPLFGISTFLLLVVLVWGKVHGGARGWIPLGPVNVQPIELAKITTVVVLAKFFHDHPSLSGYTLWELKLPIALIGFEVGLLLLQPDLGGAMLILLNFGAILLFARIETFTLAFAAVGSAVAAPLAYFFALSPYQQARILVFLHPEMDSRGRGYNSLHSKIAIGAGEMFGRGYLHGTQSKLQFLPAHHTDFIFSVLAEEWGFLGCVLLLMLLFILLFLGLRTARRSKERFGAVLAFGLVTILFWQVCVNVGGALGMMPVTGVTLPFTSYGGSALLMNFVTVGLLLNIGMRRFMF